MKKQTIQVLKWTCIGLLVRFVLMAFTTHGEGLLFVNYFPMMLVREGIWDPYGFINVHLPYFSTTYYGPVLLIIMALPNFLFANVFKAASLVKILQMAGPMMQKNLATVDYVNAFSSLELFKNLFLMKIPYLIFDFLIGMILLKLSFQKKSALSSYALWMLNIVVLHSVYALGQADLIPAFFIIAAVYAAVKKRPYLSVVLLGLGGATKLFPYFLIIPACLLLGDNSKRRFYLLLTAALVLVLIYLPFYLSSGSSVFGASLLARNVKYSGVTKWILLAIFTMGYSFLSVNAVKDSQRPNPEQHLVYYFIVTLFIAYATTSARPRYFVNITPLLALIIPRHKKFGKFIFLVILTLAFFWVSDRYQQLGLFAPLNPEYFLSFPAFQEIIGRFVNITIVYKITCRIIFLSFLAAACWAWRIKLTDRGQFNA